MKLINKYIAFLGLGSLALTACEKDGDMIYVDRVVDPVIESVSGDIVLDKDHLDVLALSVYWNENGDITLTDTLVAAPKYAYTNTLQLSAHQDFSVAYEETMGDGVYCRQFTVGELNSAAVRGGMSSGETAPIYMRIKSVIGANMAPKYSNVLSVNLTTYEIDLTIGITLDKDRVENGRTLALTDKANVFAGFYGAASWENWFFRAPEGQIYGTAADPGTAFVLGTEAGGAEIWNLWFPEPQGCYYTTVDIPGNEWTALLVKNLTLSGDVEGEMAYDRKANIWSYTFDAEAKTYSVSISGLADLYNKDGGDGAPATTDNQVGFGGSAENLTFGTSATPVSITIPAAGSTTLLIDLNNPKQWTLATGELAPVEEVSPFIYLMGIVDPWGFEDYLRIYDEDKLCYGGAHYVKSEWGYQIGVEVDNWGDIYTMVDGGNASEGTLVAGAGNNITPPAEGNYLFDISLADLWYNVTPITKVSATGMNDDWSLYEMTATDVPGVYTLEFQKTGDTPWGVKVIFNDNWALFYGGNGTAGELCYKHDGFTGDNDFAVGTTVVLTVDIFKATYSFSAKAQ